MDNLCKEVVFQKLAGVLIMDNLAMVMSELALFAKPEMECKKAHTSILMLLENVSEHLLRKKGKSMIMISSAILYCLNFI